MRKLTNPITADGPLLDFLCGVSKPRADALQRAKLTPPLQARIKALIDTGASITVIDAEVLRDLGIVATGAADVHTPSTNAEAPHTLALFDVSLQLECSTGVRL